MAKPPAKPLNQTPPPGERPPGKPLTQRQRDEKEAEKAELTEQPATEPAAADDFPEREEAPPEKPKAPVATKVTAPPARVQRDKTTGKIKEPVKPKAAPKAAPAVEETAPKDEAKPTPPAGDNSSVAQEALVTFIERIERLEGEKKGIADDIRDVYTEAKLQGFNSAIMRDCVKIRAMEPDKRSDKYKLLALYTSALGIDLGFDLI